MEVGTTAQGFIYRGMSYADGSGVSSDEATDMVIDVAAGLPQRPDELGRAIMRAYFTLAATAELMERMTKT